MTANSRSKSTAEVRALRVLMLGCVVIALTASVSAQAAKPAQAPKPAPPAAPTVPPTGQAPAVMHPPELAVPNGYRIGPDDELSIVFWKDKDMSTDARVRPDGRIALPLISEVQAAGLTPEELQKKITEESKKFMEDASITVVVRAINSLKVFITGQVGKPGVYALTSSMTVMQLISIAGGLQEYANSKSIMIMRNDGGKQTALKFNYREVASGKNLKQNIELKPGDTVVVP